MPSSSLVEVEVEVGVGVELGNELFLICTLLKAQFFYDQVSCAWI